MGLVPNDDGHLPRFDSYWKILKSWPGDYQQRRSVVVTKIRCFGFWARRQTAHYLEWRRSLAYLFSPGVTGICSPPRSPGATLCLAGWMADPWDVPSSPGMEQARRRMTHWTWHLQKCQRIKEVLSLSLTQSLMYAHRVWTDTQNRHQRTEARSANLSDSKLYSTNSHLSDCALCSITNTQTSSFVPSHNPTSNTHPSHTSVEMGVALVGVVRFPQVTSQLPVVLVLTRPHSHL